MKASVKRTQLIRHHDDFWVSSNTLSKLNTLIKAHRVDKILSADKILF